MDLEIFKLLLATVLQIMRKGEMVAEFFENLTSVMMIVHHNRWHYQAKEAQFCQ